MGAEENAESRDVWAEAVSEQQERPGDALSKAEPEPEPEGSAPSGSDFIPPDFAPLVDEVRKFATALGDKVGQASSAISGGGDPMQVLQNLAAPLRTKNPAVYGHLLAAGGELLAAYRAAVSASERRWSAPRPTSSERVDLD
ncbi:DUF5304 family protein [Streptacidiphilus monticola]|jgi:hypothetical protein|uniref:DUF5304 family protein n=1 Tax=Streptacidiphilus monticola TaxID=2161674 RepID=A0ABW1FYB4_9ACTN